MAQTAKTTRKPSKTAKRKFVKRITAEQAAHLSVIEQIERTFAPGRKLAAIVGTILGGFVPLATFTLVHFEVAAHPLLWLMVVGGLLYSAISVFKWGKQAFHMTAKAIGFVLLLEGAVTFSYSHWLSIAGLVLLIAINGVSSAVSLQAVAAPAVKTEV